MKAIAFLNQIVMLGEGTVIDILSDGITFRQYTTVTFKFADDAHLKDRLDNDEFFRGHISAIVGGTIGTFLNSREVNLLALTPSLLAVTMTPITDKEDEKKN